MFFKASVKSCIVKGTSISSCMLWRLLISKCELSNFLRIGIMAASLQTLDISAPEYPSVNLTNFSHSMPPFSSESYIPFKLISLCCKMSILLLNTISWLKIRQKKMFYKFSLLHIKKFLNKYFPLRIIFYVEDLLNLAL